MTTVVPTTPSSDDAIELVFNGGGCTDSFSRHLTYTGFELHVDLAGGCDWLPPPGFTYTWNVGRLPPGNYTVEFKVSEMGGPLSDVSRDEFSVTAGILPLPTLTLPASPVATIPNVGVGILSVLLVYIVYKKARAMG
jgi:hypothetical protein